MESSKKDLEKVKDLLSSFFPSDQLLFKPEETAIYGADASRFFKIPFAVVFPKDYRDVQKVFEVANRFKIPVIPRGRGTNVVGDCVPVKESIVVSTLYMNKILEINDKDFVAVVEPGVLTGFLQKEAEKKGLFYPPDPSSASYSTIGGNVATNAGGLRAVKYGVTKDYVLGLEVVLPTGEFLKTGGRMHKNSVGFDLVRLFVGSEGTLGFMTKIILKLLPLPEYSASAVVGFKKIETGIECIYEIFKSGILPVALEFLDEKMSKIFAEAEDLECSFIIKLDGNEDSVKRDLEKVKDVVKKADYLKVGYRGDGEEEIWETRRLLNQISFNFGPDKLSLDISIPRKELKRAMSFIKELEKGFGLPILVFGHVGDGNLHVNIMYDKKDEAKREKAMTLSKRIYRFVTKLGGSISGEHGVGIVRREFLKYQLSSKEMELMKKIKTLFDPHNIMNPEKAI